MAGGAQKYRHLSRDSSARMALLRGLVTQLVQHEHIMTTKAKAKEAARMAEKLITFAKKDTPTTRRLALAMLYEPHTHLPKLFGELKTRFLERPGGYTRVVLTEPRNRHDQAETAILELVDGVKDTQFMMAAKTVARERLLGLRPTPLTEINVKKATQFRKKGDFETMVQKFMELSTAEPDRPANPGTIHGAEPFVRDGAKMFQPKLAHYKVPEDRPSQLVQAATRRRAAPIDSEGSEFEVEAGQAAEAEAAKVAGLGSQIVPGQNKQETKK